MTIEGGNPVRNETLEQALALDTRLRELWMHHPRFILVQHDESFCKKIALGLAELDRMVTEHAGDRSSRAKQRTLASTGKQPHQPTPL